MFKLSVDAENIKSVLATLASEETANRLLTAAAESDVKDTISDIDSGNSFTERTGNLKRSIGWKLGNHEAVITATAPYAANVEFGGSIFHRKRTKPYPFIFADRANRQQNALNAARSVLEEVINERHN